MPYFLCHLKIYEKNENTRGRKKNENYSPFPFVLIELFTTLQIPPLVLLF